MQPGFAWGEDNYRNGAPLGADPLFPELAAAMREQERARQQQEIAQQMRSPTAFSAFAKMATAMLGNKREQDAEAGVQKAQQGMSDERQAELARVMAALNDNQIQPGPPTATGELSTSRVDPQEQMAALLSARDPAFRQLGIQMASGQLMPKPKKIEHVDLGDAIGILQDGQLVGKVPKGVTPDAAHRTANPDANAKLADERDRWKWANTSANANLAASTQQILHGTPSGSTIHAQDQENRRFNDMPVETGTGYVRRADAIGQPGKPSAAGASAAGREFDDARQTYGTIYGPAFMGQRTGPKFEEWLQGEWPKIRTAGGMTGPAGPNANGPISAAAPPAPQNAADRQPGTVYQTPKGPLRWMGNGWQPAS